ncbi:MAG TPA: glycosyltransferase [Elusimicrobia bacterium]|nr:MAG: glycosyl transferase [Elusimicrobia bacterium GWA2_66_18]HAZ08450.1 glycosyltransferase [Elusimicrobiota bacterium]
MTARPYLSALIPVYNEEENLPALGEEVSAALGALGKPYEVILVDDGSQDRSFEEILKLVKQYPGFKTVRLGRNAGQTAAMLAGIQHATGEVIVCLDADMQNDARDVPKLIAKMEEGYDCVSGWRKDRQDRFLDRKLPSMIANSFISRVTGVKLHDYGCTLKLYKAQYLKPLRLYGEMHRFVPALAGFLGARVAEVPVNHRARTRGVSKYGITRTFKVLLDLLTVKFMDSYLGKPIYLFGGGGVAMGLLGAAFTFDTLYKKFHLGIFVKDQPLFQVAIFCLLIGFQMVLIGLLAEILVRIYYDLKDMRPYFVRETSGFGSPPEAL